MDLHANYDSSISWYGDAKADFFTSTRSRTELDDFLRGWKYRNMYLHISLVVSFFCSTAVFLSACFAPSVRAYVQPVPGRGAQLHGVGGGGRGGERAGAVSVMFRWSRWIMGVG